MNIKNIPGIIKKQLSPKESPPENPFDAIKKMPRYSPGEFLYEGKKIVFPDAASFAAIFEEVFQRNVYKFISNKPAPVIIDCGANIGISAIYFKHLYPNSKVWAFEPDNTIFKYLSQNVSSFNYKDITLINKGVWMEDTEIKFLSEGADAGRVVKDQQDSNAININKIEVERLSKYINQQVDFLKIDIEGSEVEVIKEIENKLSYVSNLFIEYHSFVDKSQELDQILAILSRNNFRYYIYSPSKLRQFPFVDNTEFLSMDCLLNICATKR